MIRYGFQFSHTLPCTTRIVKQHIYAKPKKKKNETKKLELSKKSAALNALEATKIV